MIHDASHGYTYDAENRLTQVDGGATATYLYDANGFRVMSLVGGSYTFFTYDSAGNVVSEHDANNGWVQSYIRFGGRLLAFYRGAGTAYFHLDHLGSVRFYTSVSGSPYGTPIDYDPFGYQTSTGTTVDERNFTGKERDPESGLDNFGARYDSSSMGRFMSPDPDNAGATNENPQSWNGYAYALNNPVNNVDPNGLATKVCIDDGNGGQNCTWYANDSDFDKAVANSSGVSAQNGNVYATVDGQQVQIGTYTRDNGAPDISSDFLNLYFAGKAARGLFSLGRLAVSGVSNLFKSAAEEGAADLAIMVKPNPAEAAMMEELREAGYTVEQLPRTAGKSADFLVNGVKTELKTLAGEGPNTLKNAVETAAKQGEQILVDARGTNMTAEQAANQIARAQGNVGGLTGRVTVLTNNGVVKF